MPSGEQREIVGLERSPCSRVPRESSGTRVGSWANNGNALVRNASDDDVGESEYRKLVDEVSRRFQSQAVYVKIEAVTFERPGDEAVAGKQKVVHSSDSRDQKQ